jgi:hypothetical protein
MIANEIAASATNELDDKRASIAPSSDLSSDPAKLP